MSTDAELPTLPQRGDGSAETTAQTYGRFVARSVIGQGGMGRVLRAFDPQLDREVAIKVLRPSALGAADVNAGVRLQREAKAMAQLEHPNVVRVFDVGIAGDERYIVMELVDGATLRSWLADGTRSWREVLDMFLACGRGLVAAHAAGLVHRDFKPDNVLVADGRPQVTDFGLVATGIALGASDIGEQSLRSGLTVSGAMVGTPMYMAPEQWTAGGIDARADQFSFCVALWEGVHGEHPFGGASLGDLRERVLGGKVRPPPRERPVPPALTKVLRRGLSVDRTRRWPSMVALLTALERSVRPRRWPIALVAGAGVVALAGAAWMATRDDGDATCPDPAPRLAGVWDAPTAARVKAAFVAASPATGDEASTRVVARLDEYAAAWRAASLGACKARKAEHTQSARLFDERTVCLERRLGELRALAGSLVTADRDRVNRSIDAAGALTSIDACADEQSLLAFPPPSDPAIRRRVLEVDEAIAAASAMKFTSDVAGRQARATAALAAAREVGYPPLVLRALHELQLAATQNSDHAASKAALRELAQKAAESQDDARAATAWINLLRTLAQQHERDEAKALEPVAEAAVARAGSPPGLRFGFLVARGTRHFYAGEQDEAITFYESALPIAPDVAQRATTRRMLAQAIHMRDGAKAAIPVLEQGMTETESVYGPAHPHTADGLELMGRLLLEIGDGERAFAVQTRALAIREAALEPGNREIGTALHHLANIEERRRHPAEARALYLRAIPILEAADRPADAGMAHAMLGVLLADTEGIAAGRPHFEAGLAHLARSFGEDSVQYAQMEMNYAQRLMDADLCAEAQPHIDHLLPVFERKSQRDLPLVLSAVFVCDVKTKHVDAAIAKLERARTVCAATECEFPEELAFDLGTLLHESGRDRVRARALIDEAAKLAAANGATDFLDEIAAWRKAHR